MGESRDGIAGVAGWKQFLATKRTLLARYDDARTKAEARPVQTGHGLVAEALIREWLNGFLPRRFRACAGYLVSQSLEHIHTGEVPKLPHYDVIIYDELNAPVLWIDENPEVRDGENSRAIPVEFVHGVLEVKSSLDRTTARQAMEKLLEIQQFANGIDPPGEPYPTHFPLNFCCGTIFMELRRENAHQKNILELLIPDCLLRGYMGGAVLRGDGLPVEATGRIDLCANSDGEQIEIFNGSLLAGGVFGGAKQWLDDKSVQAFLSWTLHNFSAFAFDLLAMMQGTRRWGLSSFHGFAFQKKFAKGHEGE
ncbi:MAG: hypothetical protein RIC55_23475 [Pirellulaceae bacterium]